MMRCGLIVPICTRHSMQQEALRTARSMSRTDTPVIALLNGITAGELEFPIPDGIEVVERVSRFDDECDLWQWGLERACLQDWEWCLYLHDDFSMREPGWEAELEKARGYRVALASWLAYAVWDEEANSGWVTPGPFGVVLDSMSFAFRTDVFASRGCVAETRYGFGFGAWDANAWALEHDYAVWHVRLNSWHQWDGDNTRGKLGVGASGHPDIRTRFRGVVLPARVADDAHIQIVNRLVRIAPEDSLIVDPPRTVSCQINGERFVTLSTDAPVLSGERYGEVVPLPPVRDPLTTLADAFGSDKGSTAHNYTTSYDRLLSASRDHVRSVLELGVLHGASLKMWRGYFPTARIFGLDYATEVTREALLALNDDRITVQIGQQTDPVVLDALIAAGAPFDLVIDDAGHVPDDYLASLAALWPHVMRYYIIEDVFPEFMERTLAAIATYTTRHELIRSNNSTSTAVVLIK